MPYKDKDKERAAKRAYYWRNREKKLAYEVKRRKEWSQRLAEIKGQPCMDCGGSFHPHCMDFHHCRGDKTSEITRMVNHKITWELILEEIAKCDLLCANCHRLRHI